jgi:hypothetical protein
MSDNAKFAGQVDVQKVELTSVVNENIVDLSKIMLEMNLYEDLFSNYLTGTITISDSLDLINYMPLVGEEKLQITYKTPGIDDSIGLVDNTFYVTKITDRITVKEGQQAYVIHFVSEEGYCDTHVKLARGFKGNLAAIAKQVFNDFDALAVNEEVSKKIVIEDTANAFQIVCPNWSPFKVLNWVASRSTSVAKEEGQKEVANFICYQDVFKYNFVSINSLIAKEPVMKFYNTTLNVRQLEGLYQANDITQYNIIRTMSNDLVFDVSSRLASGMYASKMIACDLLSKTINIQDFDYIDSFKNSKHLNPYPMNSKKIMRNTSSCIVTYVMQNQMFNEFQSDFPEDWLLQRRSLMQQINSYQAEIVVPGRTDYFVGMVIDLYFNTVRNTKNESDAEESLNKGRYLVVSINHRLAKSEHECVISIVKESIIRDLG